MTTAVLATIPLRGRRRPWSSKGIQVEWRRLRHQCSLLAHWWLRPHEAYQPLFVLATHRSGSNLLVDYLNRLAGVRCQSEILCPTLAVGPRSSRLSSRQALLHMRRSLHLATTPIRGAKLMLDQLNLYRLSLDALDAAFSRPKYIVLYRQSLAEQYLSRKSAKATDQWVLKQGQDRKQVRVQVDPDELRRYCETVKQSYRKILEHRWLAERAVLVSYEELTADPDGWLSGHIAPLLGVPAGKPETCLRKQNTRPIAERVANHGEVAALLASPLCQQRYVWPWRNSAERRAAAPRAA